MFIPEQKQGDFLAELQKLNKKLAKYNSSVEILSCTPTTVYADYDSDYVYNSLVEIKKSLVNSNKYAIIAGFEYEISSPVSTGKENVEYLGKVKYTNGTPQIFSEDEKLLELVNIDQTDACDHCGTVRNRNSYFYFNEGGEIKKIGSTCVHEWFGIDVDAVFSRYQNFITYAGAISSYLPQYSKFTFLSVIINAVANVTVNFTKGWAKGESAGDAWAFIKGREVSKHNPNYDAVRESLESKWNINPSNNFEFNIVSALFYNGKLKEEISNEHFGIVSWAIWNAEYTKHDTPKTEKEVHANEYFGEVGERVTIAGALRLVYSFEGASYSGWGEGDLTYIYTITNEKGVAKWVTTKNLVHDFAYNEEGYWENERYNKQYEKIKGEGIAIEITGRIKALEEYKGENQTLLTRCKVVLK